MDVCGASGSLATCTATNCGGYIMACDDDDACGDDDDDGNDDDGGFSCTTCDCYEGPGGGLWSIGVYGRLRKHVRRGLHGLLVHVVYRH